MCNFGIFLSKFGCHGNSLCSLENSDSILQLADPTIHRKKILDFSHTTEISAISADFFLNLVSMATPLKISIVYISICRLLEPYYLRKRFFNIL